MKALFIGAGASYDCGMPLVWELTAEIRRWLPPEKIIAFNENWKSHGGGWNQDVLSCLIDLLKNNDLHYENIIGAIEVECSRERDPQKRRDYYAAHGFLLQAVYGMLLERHVKNNTYALSALDDFSGITKLVEENKPLWIFSLNHDCLIEMLAAKKNIPLKSGFNEKINISAKRGDGSISEIEFERLSRESINSKRFDFFKYGELGINLVKLHGALDIFAQNDEINYIKVSPVQNKPESYVAQLDLINQINYEIAFRDGVLCTNENVYEDENGEIQFLRKSLLSGAHKFSKKITQIAPPEFLSLFGGGINYADELICIGYSFCDNHIDEQIVEWMSFISSRKLIIVNPGITSSPDKMKHLSGQIECRPISAVDFFIQLNGAQSTPLQALFREARLLARDKVKRKLIE